MLMVLTIIYIFLLGIIEELQDIDIPLVLDITIIIAPELVHDGAMAMRDILLVLMEMLELYIQETF